MINCDKALAMAAESMEDEEYKYRVSEDVKRFRDEKPQCEKYLPFEPTIKDMWDYIEAIYDKYLCTNKELTVYDMDTLKMWIISSVKYMYPKYECAHIEEQKKFMDNAIHICKTIHGGKLAQIVLGDICYHIHKIINTDIIQAALNENISYGDIEHYGNSTHIKSFKFYIYDYVYEKYPDASTYTNVFMCRQLNEAVEERYNKELNKKKCNSRSRWSL